MSQLEHYTNLNQIWWSLPRSKDGESLNSPGINHVGPLRHVYVHVDVELTTLCLDR